MYGILQFIIYHTLIVYHNHCGLHSRTLVSSQIRNRTYGTHALRKVVSSLIRGTSCTFRTRFWGLLIDAAATRAYYSLRDCVARGRKSETERTGGKQPDFPSVPTLITTTSSTETRPPQSRLTFSGCLYTCTHTYTYIYICINVYMHVLYSMQTRIYGRTKLRGPTGP